MDIVSEEENLPSAVIPASIGGKHVGLLPGIGAVTECCEVLVGLVFQPRGLDKYGIREHVHITEKGECLYLGIISTCLALYYLPVLVPHGTAFTEDGHTVLGIVVQMACPQCVVVLVPELDHITTELSKIPVYPVYHLLAFQFGAVLNDPHMAYGFYYAGLNIPQGGIAQQIGIVVKKGGITCGSPVCHAVPLHLTQGVSAHKTHKTVLRLFFLGKGGKGGQHQQQADQVFGGWHNYCSSVLNLSVHPSLLKGQSLKRGSMTI